MSNKKDTHAKGMGKKSARHPNKMIRQYRLLLDKEGEVLPCTPRELSRAISDQMRELGTDPIPFALQPSDAFRKDDAAPDNVTDIAAARKRKESARLEKKKAKAAKNNKPKQPKPKPKAKVKCVNSQGWLHNTAMAIGEFRRWAKRPANGSNQLQYQQRMEEHKAASLNGVPRVNKKVQNLDSKISAVHNPGLSATPVVLDKSKLPDINKPLDPKFWNPAAQRKVRLAPSGLPMEMFEPGGKYGPASNDAQSPVVYTAQQKARETAREYRAQRDASLVGYVSQVVNTVEPQFWSRVLYDYVEVRGDDDYIVQTGAINKTVNTEDERVITRALLDTMAAYAYWQDEERSSLVIERNTLEWELGARINTGADDEQREIPTPPEDCDQLVAEVNTFTSLMKFEGPERTYARYVYGDPKLGDTIRQHMDARAQERMDAVELRSSVRGLTDFFTQFAEYHAKLFEDYAAGGGWYREPFNQWANRQPNPESREEYIDWWKASQSAFAEFDDRTRKVKSAVVHAPTETYLLHRKHVDGIDRLRSTYYSRLTEPSFNKKGWGVLSLKNSNGEFRSADRVQYTNGRVASVLLSAVTFSTYRYCGNKCHAYVEWWEENAGVAEALLFDKTVKELETTRSGRTKLAVVKAGVSIEKGFKKVRDVLNTNIDPASRRQDRERLEQLEERRKARDTRRAEAKQRRAEVKAKKLAKRLADAEAEHARQVADADRKAQRDAIRKAQRIAH